MSPPRARAPIDSDDEEQYEYLATQAIREKYANVVENLPAERGIIESVHVENFMCHKNFLFKFGPLINFVCGKNGSGKSAVLTALTLCLGGKASSTNRGQSLKTFVKEGKDQAVITVRIKNQGDLAYMPDEYGSSIIVERRFNRSGASGFRLKSEKGRIVSTKKADLDEICDELNLQMDNPLNVLSQDMARQFISGSNASDKYKFFVRGVLLEQLDQDYRILEENLDNIEAKLGEKRPELKFLRDKMERAKSKLALSDKHNVIRDKLRDYRRQLAWAQVEAQERIRDEFVQEIENADEKIAEAEARATTLDARYEAADRASGEAAVAHQQTEHEEMRDQGEKAEAKERFDEVKKETMDVQSEQRGIRSAMKEAEAMIISKKREINEEEQRLADLDGGGAAARLALLEDVKEAATSARQDFEVHQKEKIQVEQDLERANRHLQSLQDPLRAKRAENDRRKEDLDGLSRDRGQEDLAFHQQMPTLLRAIQDEHSFGQTPIGPVGKHVRLLKPEWSSVLEKSFGGTLGSFIVTSKRDMDILNGIMKRVRCPCPIIIGNNQPLNTSPNEPDPAFDTTLRALDIDNDLVRKQLVIQHGIEQTILIADMEEASNVLYDGPRPRNVRRCYCINKYNKRKGHMLSFTRNGEASQDPIHEYTGRPRIKTDIDAQLRLRQEALQDTRRELNELDAQLQTSRETVERTKQALVRHKRRTQELQVAYQKADDKVEEITGAISDDNLEGGKLQVLQAALKEAEDAKNLHEGSYEDSVIALDNKKAMLREAKSTLDSFDVRITELHANSKKAEVTAQRLSKKRATALGEKNAAIGRIDDAKQDRASLERKRQEMNGKIEEWTGLARAISERVNIDDGETEASLKKKYEKLNSDYQKFQRQVGATREEIAADAAETNKVYQISFRRLEELETLSWKLKGSLLERRERWKTFRSFISCRAKAQFTYFLSERSFRGKLITDHRQKLLELSVEPDITKRDASGRGAKTLSGGEKSFSQICLLLSIWEAMGSPIRCLDEFDVFMDSVNRKMSIELLIIAARRSVGRQFILISPGTRADIPKDPDVHSME